MDAYDMRRTLHWVCVHMRRGESLKDVIRAAAERKPPLPAEWIRELWPHARIACANVGRLNACLPWERIGDVIELPPE